MGISGMLLIVACQDIPFYSSYKSVDAQGWNAVDTLVFKLPSVDEERQFDVNVDLRTVSSFKYNNLKLAVRLYEGKRVVSVDTVAYKLYNEKGKRLGKGFPYVEYNSTLKHSIRLLPEKKYRVKVTHIMRMDPFDGISDVGITIK